MAARLLIEQGHGVVLHARNQRRAQEALAAVPGAETVVIGDLASIAQTRSVADQVEPARPLRRRDSQCGRRISRTKAHRDRGWTSAGVRREHARALHPDCAHSTAAAPRLFELRPAQKRRCDLKDLAWENRPWQGQQAYSDSKLHDVLLAFAVARRWPDVFSNALEPGWVATKMGGPGAPDDLGRRPPHAGLARHQRRRRRRGSRASISITCGCAHRTRRRATRSGRSG